MTRQSWFIFGAALIVAGLVSILLLRSVELEPPEPARPAPAVVPPAPVAPSQPQVQYPIEPEAAEPPLPTLGDSDALVREAVAGLVGSQVFARLFVPEDLVRRIVATVDALTQPGSAQRRMPTQPVPGRFRVETIAGVMMIDAVNSARYAPFVRALEAVDVRSLVDVYVRLYPLFQEAYRELGYPQGHFNDRLVHVLDHVLAAPEAAAPIRLVLPKVMYEFADEHLAALSAGQKILVRMGTVNAAIVRERLRAIRHELVLRSGRPA